MSRSGRHVGRIDRRANALSNSSGAETGSFKHFLAAPVPCTWGLGDGRAASLHSKSLEPSRSLGYSCLGSGGQRAPFCMDGQRMRPSRFAPLLTIIAVILSGCGSEQSETSSNSAGSAPEEERRETIWDHLHQHRRPEYDARGQQVHLERFARSPELPSGRIRRPLLGRVIVTGYGTPPGGNRAYRATIIVRDPAL